jgi:SAM-dependent methyltransferase
MRGELRNIAAPVESDWDGLSAGDHHYRAYVGPPQQYDLIGATQFNLLTALGLRDHHYVLDFGCGSLRAGRLLISYLRAGRYYGVEPNRWLIDDALRCELGQEIALVKAPVFSYGANFDISFGRRFDYILIQSIFTHTGSDLATRLLGAVGEALEPGGMAVVTFLKVDLVGSDSVASGWVYPDCVGYSGETIRRMAAEAGLDAHELVWYNPRMTWFLLTHPGKCPWSAAQMELLEGPVLIEPDFLNSQFPREGRIATIEGKERFVRGSLEEVQSASLGFIDAVEEGGATVSIQGWVLEPGTNAPAVWVAAVHAGRLMRPVECSRIERPDVARHLALNPTLAAGFLLVARKPLGFDPGDLRVVAHLPGGSLVELGGIRTPAHTVVG